MAAWRPSSPASPTPTCATRIIGTSFAPSPIERVSSSSRTRLWTRRTTSAFWSAVTRQKTTDTHIDPSSKSFALASSSVRMCLSVSPSITRALFLNRPASRFASGEYASTSSESCSMASVAELASILMRFM
eukprot:Amastigsp_a178309_13.p5 type:complete len:131 gc:universal Amastigsp_a178309_13:899-1291(+)